MFKTLAPVRWGFLSVVLSGLIVAPASTNEHSKVTKPTPQEIIERLKDGNERFVRGESRHPNLDKTRLLQAGTQNQADHAIATVITCSDSRVPVELVFDVGIMDIFVIRVAGNVCDNDEVGSIEYGLGHVHTPLLVILGHSQCGAVTAVCGMLHGEKGPAERNIPTLIDNVFPAARRAMEKHPNVVGGPLIEMAIEENVYQGMRDLFERSPETREWVKRGEVKVVGAIYDVATGSVRWLDEGKAVEILAESELPQTSHLLANPSVEADSLIEPQPLQQSTIRN